MTRRNHEGGTYSRGGMATVWLDLDMVAEAKRLGVNISATANEAIRRELERQRILAAEYEQRPSAMGAWLVLT